ncbi:MAG: hypothetical protein L7U72_00800 [Rubripirellula sp.]|nr:hypothetical protein [Rubripirellula sp.]
MQKKVLIIYAILLLISVPWYWQFFPSLSQARILGFPMWVVSSLLGSALVSAHTMVLLLKPWEGELEPASESPEYRSAAEAFRDSKPGASQ